MLSNFGNSCYSCPDVVDEEDVPLELLIIFIMVFKPYTCVSLGVHEWCSEATLEIIGPVLPCFK